MLISTNCIAPKGPEPILTRLVFVLSVLVTLATAVPVVTPAEALQQPPDSMSEFKPITELPPTEKLPAAPFLISAYSIVWLIVLFYIWTIWRRMTKLELEFRTLERRIGGPQ